LPTCADAPAADFLGAGFTGFPIVNTSATRRSSAVAAAVQNRFRLPAAMLDRIYDDASVRRFYGDQEIESFKRRWQAG
jgi:hypothetical protein